MTTTEVARQADCSSDLVRQWHRLGKLEAQRTVSGQRLFRRADVVAFLAAREAARLDRE